MITGMDFVSLPARDLAALRKFYEDELGFPKKELDGSPWTEFDLGPGPALSLTDAKAMGMADDPVTTGTILFSFKDLEGKLAHLKARGFAATETEPFESPVCHGAVARDAHGNSIMLHRRKQDPGAELAIDAVVLPSPTPKATAAWYKEALGLQTTSIETDEWVEFELPDGSALAIGDPRRMGIPADPVKTGAPALATPDLEAVFARLKADGMASQDEIIETPVCHMAFVHDPHGNELILHRHK